MSKNMQILKLFQWF